MSDIFSLKESVLVFLDRSGGLEKLFDDCKQYNGKSICAAILASVSSYLVIVAH